MVEWFVLGESEDGWERFEVIGVMCVDNLDLV